METSTVRGTEEVRLKDEGCIPENLRATGKAVLGTRFRSRSSDGNSRGKD